jgi:chloramphenicol O-acetyltransferase type A
MPWLQLTAIEHPVYRHKEADIPSLAWGRFSDAQAGMMTVPFAVQAHHGFVDGYHIHLLGQAVAQRLRALMEA